jgi:hypothetical protein
MIDFSKKEIFRDHLEGVLGEDANHPNALHIN